MISRDVGHQLEDLAVNLSGSRGRRRYLNCWRRRGTRRFGSPSRHSRRRRRGRNLRSWPHSNLRRRHDLGQSCSAVYAIGHCRSQSAASRACYASFFLWTGQLRSLEYCRLQDINLMCLIRILAPASAHLQTSENGCAVRVEGACETSTRFLCRDYRREGGVRADNLCSF